MKITLKDIAEDTGFSISTISRVLNNSDKISSDTRKKVLSSAKKLGYKIAKNGDSASKKHLNIALVATGFHQGEFYTSYLYGLNKAAQQNNVRLFLSVVIDHQKGLVKLLKSLASEYYDGIVLCIPELFSSDHEIIASELPNDFPVLSNSLIENPVFPTITFDSYSGGYLAAKHFHEQGYKKVGIILGPSERSESRFRKNGFTDYVTQQRGMELTWSCDGDYTFQSGISAFENFLQKKNKPEAVFAANDTMANGFLQTAKKNHFKIPEDVALIGYDDLPYNEHTQPALSSIRTDYEKLGNATIKALLETLSENNFTSNVLSFVPVSVSHRESS